MRYKHLFIAALLFAGCSSSTGNSGPTGVTSTLPPGDGTAVNGTYDATPRNPDNGYGFPCVVEIRKSKDSVWGTITPSISDSEIKAKHQIYGCDSTPFLGTLSGHYQRADSGFAPYATIRYFAKDSLHLNPESVFIWHFTDTMRGIFEGGIMGKNLHLWAGTKRK